MYAGTCCVSICTALFGSAGRASRNIPANSGLSTVGLDQKLGTKNVTGPLKLPVFRKSVQHWLPVGTSLPRVVFFAAVSGSGREPYPSHAPAVPCFGFRPSGGHSTHGLSWATA